MSKGTIWGLFLLLLAAVDCGGPPTGNNPGGDTPVVPTGGGPALVKIETRHLGQLTNTALNPLPPLGMTGTDLGSSFDLDNRLIFLFGDSRSIDPAFFNDDSVAWADPTVVPSGYASVPKLNWFLDGTGSGRFLSLLMPSVDLKGMNVPVEGLAIGTTTYVFASTGWSSDNNRHCCSALTHTEGSAFGSLVLDHVAESSKFINVSAIVDTDAVWIFGSGAYRQSPVYLAKVDPQRIADRSAWQYYRGDLKGAHVFSSEEADAAPVVAENCVGELSVRKHSELGYLMAYNCSTPRGIHLRFAPKPTGPWSPLTLIFDPGPAQDHGYGYFMHQKASQVGYDDGLSEPGREEEWGGEYGPYLVPQWFTSYSSGVYSIAYTLSSWNPYEVHLMESVVAQPGVSASPLPPGGLGFPPASLTNGDFASGDLSGWNTSGDSFSLFKGSDGRWRMTSYVLPKGDGVIGKLWQDFTVDSEARELRFSVFGGDAAVKLLRGSDPVRVTRGRRTNVPETPVRWFLTEYSGETLRLVIDDDKTDSWGYIGTTGFEFVREP